MAEYLSPGVYIEDNPNPPIVESASASTGGFIGITQRGVVGKPVFITSWNAYIDTFAKGMDSPFLAGSDLAYAVYGFFQNGGKRCYVQRVASEGAKCSEMKNIPETPTLVLSAKDEGAWGDNLSVKIEVNADNSSNYDIEVKLYGEVVEYFANLSTLATDENYWLETIESSSSYIKPVSGNLTAMSETSFTGGRDGASDILDADYEGALARMTADDLNLLCIPGQTSATINNALMSFCETRKDVFAIVDAPKASTVETVKALRKTISCKNGALYFPWIKVSDPLSKTGKLRDCPTCGHVMGVYARVISERGVWKVPAGTEALVRGAIDVLVPLSTADVDVLNPVGIVPVVAKANYGIVLWGARNLNPDSSMRYISDVLLDINIKKSVYNSTQPFVFEPNASETWEKVTATVQSYLDTLWRDGALAGEEPEQAYFVKCDEELNPASVRNSGRLICEVGYANKKPAEFVIFRFSHSVASN